MPRAPTSNRNKAPASGSESRCAAVILSEAVVTYSVARSSPANAGIVGYLTLLAEVLPYREVRYPF